MVKYFGKVIKECEMVNDLRKRNCDVNNDISDDFLINEAYMLGEWDIIE